LECEAIFVENVDRYFVYLTVLYSALEVLFGKSLLEVYGSGVLIFTSEYVVN
jgi:hypothetical protein